MEDGMIYMLFYFANLAFIVTNIYGWILKEFHMAKPYREYFEKLFPAQRFVRLLYLAQLMEIPYLLMIGQPKALFYINAFSVLYFASMVVIIGKAYFFWHKYKIRQLFLYFLPMYLPVGWLLLAALDLVPTTPDFYRWMFWVICIAFLYYLIRIVIIQKKILNKANEMMEGNNTSDESFPIKLSLRTRWLLLPIPLLMFVCFLCNDGYVKMGRDILFTLVNVWFLLYTIKPHRKMIQEQTVSGTMPKRSPKYKLTPQRYFELEQQLMDKMENEKVFLNPALTIDSLAEQLGSNKNYVSEVISRGKFGSYYALINHFRVEHAIMMLKENPKQKMEYVSKVSGFSSTSVFSQVFKRSNGISPTQFVQGVLAKIE